MSLRLPAGIAAAALVAWPATGRGHPMGNTSINHYAGLEIGPEVVEIRYLLDFAEIPSARELESIDPDRDDRVTLEEREAYLREKTAEVIPRLRIEVNGRALAIRPDRRHVSFPPGEGGLSTVRVAWRLHANLQERSRERNFLVWNDTNYERNPGWKEVRFTGTGGVGIGKTSLRDVPSSDELTDYPERFVRPPNDTKAWCQFGPEAEMAPAGARPAAGAGSSPPSRGSRRPLLTVIAALAVAAAAGVLALRRRRVST